MEDLRGRLYIKSAPITVQGRKMVRPLFHFKGDYPIAMKEFYTLKALNKLYRSSPDLMRYDEAMVYHHTYLLPENID